MATTKRKRKMLNVIMVALAAIVVVAGIAFFMSVRGGQETSSFVVSSKIGYANIERAGISYVLDEGTALQAEDIVETLDGSEIGLKGSGETSLYLADASKMQVNAVDAASAKTSLELVGGCIYADAQSADDPLALESMGLAWTADDAVFVSDVRTGAVTVQVLSGEVAFEDGAIVKVGESRTVIINQASNSTDGAETSSADASSANAASAASSEITDKLALSAMNSFALEHALDSATAGRELVFSKDQINNEIERRKNERQQQSEQATTSATVQTQDAADGSDDQQGSADSEQAGAEEGNGASTQDSAAEGNGGMASGSGNESVADNGGSETGNSANGSAEGAAGEPTGEPVVDPTYVCTIQIRCDTILDNMDALVEGKSKYIPRDGVILATTTVEFNEGDSAFDVLQRVCSEYGIAVEYSYAPVYGSYYIEGIGNLYEFDCGDESGWMYKVNGWFPNYGCSEYPLSDGDAIVFCYTCRGLGEDVGA